MDHIDWSRMSKLLCVILGGAIFATGCGTTAADGGGAAADAAITGGTPKAESSSPAPSRQVATKAPAPSYREVTIPSGTTLRLSLTSAVASDTSKVEDAVTAELTQAVTVDGRDVLPAGSTVAGQVTSAEASGRVKGRAQVAFRFNTLTTAGTTYDMQTAGLTRVASATKSDDATKIGIGAGAGAVVGGLLGGKSGAAKGAAVGGGAGTGLVLATKGQEMRLAPGADVTTTLSAPLTVRVRIG
jgi:hypothetical protein